MLIPYIFIEKKIVYLVFWLANIAKTLELKKLSNSNIAK